MARAKTLIRSWAQMGYEPGEAFYHINNQLCDGNEKGMFVTVWFAVIDLKTGDGIAANAGHAAPCICRKDGAFELASYEHDIMLGILDNKQFKQHEFKLYPGDYLFVYTDGVSEAMDEEEQLFGTDRLLEALNEAPGASPGELIKTVRKRVDSFAKAAEQFDDITMMCLHYLGDQ
ncbi:MAG: serine/threonine-protein phosphatase [Lachnospiraceae bacterium]|nr:serine/threonine-protein phosphatase [Lachnospiraceae bacterium]